MFFIYTWAKKCMKMCVMLFKIWKSVFKHTYQTMPIFNKFSSSFFSIIFTYVITNVVIYALVKRVGLSYQLLVLMEFIPPNIHNLFVFFFGEKLVFLYLIICKLNNRFICSVKKKTFYLIKNVEGIILFISMTWQWM